LAITGSEDVLDLQPTDLHQRCPIFIGSTSLVNQSLTFLMKFGADFKV